MSPKFSLFCLYLTHALFTASSGVEGQENSLAGVVRGEKKNEKLWHVLEVRTFYTFRPFWNTTVNTRNYEIASEKDDKVTAIETSLISTITHLPIKVAEVFPNLIQYRAAACSVEEISAANFKNMENLEVLYLHANKISSIDKDSFEDLIALEELFLNLNQLTSLHEDTFNNNRRLQVLFLSENQFESFPPKLLQNLSELREIWLGNNGLQTLNASFFAQNLKLKYISFTGNKCISQAYGKFDGRTYEDLSQLLPDLAQNCSQTPA